MVYAFIYLHTESDDGETVYRINIPVKKRGKPIDQEATPQEQSTITQAIAELNNAINVSNSNAEYAEGYMNQAHGYSMDAYNYANTASEQAILAGRSAETAEQMKNDAIGAATRASASATRAEDNAVIAVNSANAAAQSAEDAESSAESAISSATDAAASAQSAHSSAQSIQSMTVEATTLTPGSPATAAWSNGTLSLGIPAGSKGDPGEGITYHVCSSGEYDASTGEPTIQSPQENIIYLVPSQDSDNPNLFTEWIYVNSAWEMFGSGGVDLTNYVRNTDYANSTTGGVVKVSPNLGLTITNTGMLEPTPPLDTTLKGGSDGFRPITSHFQHKATFYGLAKAAGHDEKDSVEEFGTYSDAAKIAIRTMIGAIGEDDIPVEDVQINGTSVVNNGVANIPVASASTPGVVRTQHSYGTNMETGTGVIYVVCAEDSHIKQATQQWRPIVPANQHKATFYGLAKAAGDTTQSQSNNAVGTYTDDAKSAIQSMLGVPSVDDIPEVPVTDVQLGGSSIVGQDGVVNITVGGGLTKSGSDILVNPATPNQIKIGVANRMPVAPATQEYSAFYGLSKAAGVDLANETVTFGTYPATSQAAIKSMIGVNVDDVQVNGTSVVSNGVANIPVANANDLGAVLKNAVYGIDIYGNGSLALVVASDSDIKRSYAGYRRAILTQNQNQAVFYGLAKAAGADEKDSTLPMGTYTDTAKVAIRNMIGATGESATITVTGTDPVITAQSNARYICGEVLSLTFTPPATGICEVIFTSGSSVTVLDLPQTVMMPDWFEVETNKTYDISIVDGIYGAVMSW